MGWQGRNTNSTYLHGLTTHYMHKHCTHTTIQCNPFKYRITKAFTSSESGIMTFDDFLEMATVMGDKVMYTHAKCDTFHTSLNKHFIGTSEHQIDLGLQDFW